MPHKCQACGRDVDEWADGPGGRSNARCPSCGSLERHRFLAYLLNHLDPVIEGSHWVLDVAPNRPIQELLESRVGHRYVGVDRSIALDVDVVGDLQRLPFASANFGTVICYHVLEHVRDDQAAMRELARVLDPAGVVILQVPRRPTAPTLEDPDAPREVRIERFGQEDHVRYYGRDLEDRLGSAGLFPEVLSPASMFDVDAMARFGFADEEVWICGRRPLPSSSGVDAGTWLEATIAWVLDERSGRPDPPAVRPKPRRHRGLIGRAVRYIRRFGSET